MVFITFMGDTRVPVLLARAQLVSEHILVVQFKNKLLQKVELGSTLCNMLLQLATLKFVARQVEHAVVVRITTRSTCNNVAREVEQKCCPYCRAFTLEYLSK